MKKLTIIACFVALTAVACVNESQKEETKEGAKSEVATTAEGEKSAEGTEGENTVIDYNSDIAFVNTDAVFTQSELFLTEGVALQEKTQKSQESWNKTEQGFQWEISQLQNKAQKGLITSANAQKESSNIESRYKAFQTKTQKEMQALEEESQVFQNRANDLMQRAIKELNADKKFKVILSSMVILDQGTISDQTDEVLEIVNKLYAAEKK